MRIIFSESGALSGEKEEGEGDELTPLIKEAKSEYAKKRKALQEEIIAKYRPLLSAVKGK